jgi:hypothetical protein
VGLSLWSLWAESSRVELCFEPRVGGAPPGREGGRATATSTCRLFCMEDSQKAEAGGVTRLGRHGGSWQQVAAASGRLC